MANSKKATIKLKAAMLDEIDTMLDNARDRKNDRERDLESEKEALAKYEEQLTEAEKNGEDTWSFKYNAERTEERIKRLEIYIEAYNRIEEMLSEIF